MANTKTQKIIKLSQKKSQMILEWFINIGCANIKNRKAIEEKLNKSKATIYRSADKLKEIEEKEDAFEALATVFTLKELNELIELFNLYQTLPPEEKMTKEEKHKVKVNKQKEIVNKHLNEMGMEKLSDDMEVVRKMSTEVREEQ